METALTTKIFIGFSLNAEIAHELSKSREWKEASITRHLNPDEIQEIIFQDKKYIGRYIRSTKTCIKEIEEEEKALRKRVADFIQGPKAETLNLQVIAQYFLC
jgi:hypothetical protein